MATRRTATLALVGLALLGGPAESWGQVSRQTYTGAFTTDRPGAATGLAIGFDYRDPADPDGKPPAVERVVQALHAGTRIDTSVPERCDAPDARLIAEGPAACPDGSRVGSGVLHADTGAPGAGAPRVVEFRVTLLNASEQLILFLESENLPMPARLVSRSRVEDPRTYVSETPPLPAADPDDPFVAIKHVRLSVGQITRDGRAYLTTPPSCPASGAWGNRATFSYRDGTEETVEHRSPCRPAPAAGPAGSEARAGGGREAGATLVVSRPPASARGLRRRGGLRVALRVDGTVRDVRVRLVSRRTRRTIASAMVDCLTRDTRVFLRRTARPRPGRHEVVVEADSSAGGLRATRSTRLRR
jgi:hypothetical protein